VETSFDFSDLFILDLANNHQGDAGHGLRIIREAGEVVRANGARAALKFQFRNLDEFIHRSHRNGSTNKHIPRFLSTRLSDADFERLTEAVRASGMITMCTPFDEASVHRIVDMGIEVVKVASCSATDWPLLETISNTNKPVVFSTGGMTWKQVDDLVSFFDHRRVHFAIMHCVSIYPTPNEHLQLDRIRMLSERYPRKVVGFSTHEPPDALAPVQVAVAKGARMLERHVGIQTDSIKLNAYSSTPEQIDRWIKAAQAARVMCGNSHPVSTEEETEALQSLRRGVYARRPIKIGEVVAADDVYFAMPWSEGQLSSGEWRSGIEMTACVEKDGALTESNARPPEESAKQALFTAIHTAKAMLNEARIAIPAEFETEFSHHYGLDEFEKVGIIMITCVNRSYCKKLVLQLPGQRHPMHYHMRKEETFQVLHGSLEIDVDGRRRTLLPGDTQLVQQGVWHAFWTKTGVIFEEISTTHYADDSFYEDKSINARGAARKTVVNQWGRYQI